jgi:hypothetical protein
MTTQPRPLDSAQDDTEARLEAVADAAGHGAMGPAAAGRLGPPPYGSGHPPQRSHSIRRNHEGKARSGCASASRGVGRGLVPYAPVALQPRITQEYWPRARKRPSGKSGRA